jgi:hypothetical protein
MLCQRYCQIETGFFGFKVSNNGTVLINLTVAGRLYTVIFQQWLIAILQCRLTVAICLPPSSKQASIRLPNKYSSVIKRNTTSVRRSD